MSIVLTRNLVARSVQTLMACAAMAGCDATMRVANPVAMASASANDERLAALAPNGGMPKIRDAELPFANLAQDIPSSAGFFVDSTGTVVFLIKDPADDFRAASALSNVLARGHLRRDGWGGGRSLNVQRHRILRADFSFHQLARWRDIAFDSVFGRFPAVAVLDLDEVRNRVTIGLRSMETSTQHEIAALLAKSGVDPAALYFESTDLENLASSNSSLLRGAASGSGTSLLDVHYPSVAGMSHYSRDPSLNIDGNCTIGAIVMAGPNLRAVVASHCTNNTYQYNGYQVLQGDRSASAKLLGVEVSDPSGWRCTIYLMCRYSDAALVSVQLPSDAEVGLIARTTLRNSGGLHGGDGSIIIDQANPYITITSVEANDVIVGVDVDKVGWRTGWTHGPVTATCVDGSGESGFATVCMNRADVIGYYGDSGGPVFVLKPDGTAKLAGLVTMRGSSKGELYYSRWSYVVQELGLMIATAPY